jgi:hypothetical protein
VTKLSKVPKIAEFSTLIRTGNVKAIENKFKITCKPNNIKAIPPFGFFPNLNFNLFNISYCYQSCFLFTENGYKMASCSQPLCANTDYFLWFKQESLPEGEGSVQLTSLDYLVSIGSFLY